MAERALEDLFYGLLKDVYYAERKILKALPKMAKAAEAEELRDETEGQLERLQQVFEILGKRAVGKTCPAIDGLIEEGEEILDEFKNSPALDAGLLAAAQAVEHYEMARYGALKTWAMMLGLNDAVKLLDETLQQEGKTDHDLTKLAEASVNATALKKAA